MPTRFTGLTLLVATACGSSSVVPDASTPDATLVADARAPLDGSTPDATVMTDAGLPCDGPVRSFTAPDWLDVTGLDSVGVDHLAFGSRNRAEGDGEGRPVVFRRNADGGTDWAVELVGPAGASQPLETAFQGRGAAAPDGSFRVTFASPTTWTVVGGAATGDVVWAVSFAAPDAAAFAPRVALAVAPDGGAIVAATLSDDVVVVALDDRGTVVSQLALRAPDVELATGLARLASGDTMLLAWSTSFSEVTYEGPYGTRPLELAWVVTLGADGSVRRQQAIRPTFASPDLVRPELTAVAEDASGGLRIAGSAWSAGGLWGFEQSIWLLAADGTGTIAGSRRLHELGRGGTTLVEIDAAERGRWVLLGDTNAGSFLTTLSASGTVERHLVLQTASAMAGALGDGYLLAAGAPPCGYYDLPDLCRGARPDGVFLELARSAGGFALAPCAAPLVAEPPSAPAIEVVRVVTFDTDAVVVPARLGAITTTYEARSFELGSARLCFSPGCST